MKYFFNLGTNPALSIAELSAVFDLKNSATLSASKDFLIWEKNEEINASELIKKLGGTIKIGEIFDLTENNQEKIISIILKKINELKIDGKFKFGISYYGHQKFNSLKVGLEIKKELKNNNINSRLVTSKEKILSSVIVEQNKLISKGLEIILIEAGHRIMVGATLAVQPFKELSFRDYGRPGRDDRSGMLPPKLAQIMINLSQSYSPFSKKIETKILDPFCGSGTILTEAMLLGFDKLIGSDISQTAIADTEKNIHWVAAKYQKKNFTFKLYPTSATEISKNIKASSIDAVVTEPYLGPQRGHIDYKKTTQELNLLYSRAIKEIEKILKPGARAVMAWPIYNNGTLFLNPGISKLKIYNPLPIDLTTNYQLKLTERKTIIYGRPGQKVWREIIILQK